jgi:hypothetical protein
MIIGISAAVKFVMVVMLIQGRFNDFPVFRSQKTFVPFAKLIF